MKNKQTFIIVIFALLTITLGCGWIPSGGDAGDTGAPSANSAENASAPMAKTGVQECDELIDAVNRDNQAQDQGYIAGKARELFVDYIKDSIKRSIEENQGDKTKIASDCRLIKQEYEKNRSSQQGN